MAIYRSRARRNTGAAVKAQLKHEMSRVVQHPIYDSLSASQKDRFQEAYLRARLSGQDVSAAVGTGMRAATSAQANPFLRERRYTQFPARRNKWWGRAMHVDGSTLEGSPVWFLIALPEGMDPASAEAEAFARAYLSRPRYEPVLRAADSWSVTVEPFADTPSPKAKKNTTEGPQARGFTFQHADMNEEWATWAAARQGIQHRGQGYGPGSWPVGAQANPRKVARKIRDLNANLALWHVDPPLEDAWGKEKYPYVLSSISFDGRATAFFPSDASGGRDSYMDLPISEGSGPPWDESKATPPEVLLEREGYQVQLLRRTTTYRNPRNPRNPKNPKLAQFKRGKSRGKAAGLVNRKKQVAELARVLKIPLAEADALFHSLYEDFSAHNRSAHVALRNRKKRSR